MSMKAEAHNTNPAQMLLEKITHSVSWFFRITLAKIRTLSWLFQHPCPNFRTFQDQWEPCTWRWSHITFWFASYTTSSIAKSKSVHLSGCREKHRHPFTVLRHQTCHC